MSQIEDVDFELENIQDRQNFIKELKAQAQGHLGRFDSENQYLFTRKVILSGELDSMKIEELSNKIYFLEYLSKKQSIQLIINSYGGDAYDSLYIVDLMENSKCPIHTLVMGKAMSAAFTIAISGKKGCRYMTRWATMMAHEVTSESAEGKTSDIKIEVEECERIEAIFFNKIVKGKTNCPKIVVDKMKKKDTYFSAKECLKYGFIDKII